MKNNLIKIIFVLAVLACILCLSACSSQNENEEEVSGTVTMSQEETSQETTQATTETTTQTTTESTTQTTTETTTETTTQTTTKKETTTKKATTTKKETTTKKAGSFDSSDLKFTYEGSSVSLGDNIKSAVKKFGDPVSTESAPSCHGVGDDLTYYYKGFEIYTYPSDDDDLICEILVTSSKIATSKGVTVGDSKQDVIDAYGDNYEVSGYYLIYSSGAKSLQFFIENKKVTEIDYYYDV